MEGRFTTERLVVEPWNDELSSDELLDKSRNALRRELGKLPNDNPFDKFATKFAVDLEWLKNEPMETFHTYSFATLRQYGACYELVQTYLDWLAARGESGVTDIAKTFAEISNTSKAFQFKLARSMARKKELDMSPLDKMSSLWHQGTSRLKDLYL